MRPTPLPRLRSAPLARRALGLALALASGGCITAMELGRAETLKGGDWELGAAFGASGYANEKKVPTSNPTGGVVFFIPVLPFDVWGAYGVTDRLEASLRLGTVSAQAALKAGLVRSRPFSLALSAGVSADGYGRFRDDTAVRSRLALVAGARLAERFEVDLAPQASWPLDPARGRPELLGGTASVYYGPFRRDGGRVGLAVTWLRYRAPAPDPGDMRQADYVGVALVRASPRIDDRP